jgi:hypothetical protein
LFYNGRPNNKQKQAKMQELQKFIDRANDHDRKYYTHLVSKMTPEEQQRFADLTLRFDAAGAKDALGWAHGELQGKIPQLARFLVLKNLHDTVTNIPANTDMAADFHPNPEEILAEMTAALGEEKVNKFLTAYGLGLANNFISLLDEGNCNREQEKITWGLFELDPEERTLGRRIAGLHEDIVDFDQEVK